MCLPVHPLSRMFSDSELIFFGRETKKRAMEGRHLWHNSQPWSQMMVRRINFTRSSRVWNPRRWFQRPDCELLDMTLLLSGTVHEPKDSETRKSEASTVDPLLSPAVLERMKQRRASIQPQLSTRRSNSIDLSSFGKGLVVDKF